jgi:hypothetical protein
MTMLIYACSQVWLIMLWLCDWVFWQRDHLGKVKLTASQDDRPPWANILWYIGFAIGILAAVFAGVFGTGKCEAPWAHQLTLKYILQYSSCWACIETVYASYRYVSAAYFPSHLFFRLMHTIERSNIGATDMSLKQQPRWITSTDTIFTWRKLFGCNVEYPLPCSL